MSIDKTCKWYSFHPWGKWEDIEIIHRQHGLEQRKLAQQRRYTACNKLQLRILK